MVDCLFQLQTRGFFRRQVFAVARQALSLVAGEAIDNYLTSQLRLLRQQHTIGRIIQRIQASLWPGGVWFQRTPAFLAQQAVQQQAAAAAAAPDARSGSNSSSSSARPAGMEPERYLDPG
jgi:sorting nexin-13